jgi:hypothetical protein
MWETHYRKKILMIEPLRMSFFHIHIKCAFLENLSLYFFNMYMW